MSFAQPVALANCADPFLDGQQLRSSWEDLLAQHAVDLLSASMQASVTTNSPNSAFRENVFLRGLISG